MFHPRPRRRNSQTRGHCRTPRIRHAIPVHPNDGLRQVRNLNFRRNAGQPQRRINFPVQLPLVYDSGHACSSRTSGSILNVRLTVKPVNLHEVPQRSLGSQPLLKVKVLDLEVITIGKPSGFSPSTPASRCPTIYTTCHPLAYRIQPTDKQLRSPTYSLSAS